MMDAATIPIGVPGFLSPEGAEEEVAHRFYFMAITPPGATPLASSAAGRTSAGTPSSGCSAGSGCSGAVRLTPLSVDLSSAWRGVACCAGLWEAVLQSFARCAALHCEVPSQSQPAPLASVLKHASGAGTRDG
jgi:hypothetical protein